MPVAAGMSAGLLVPKSRRECYCGNLAVGEATPNVLWQAIKRLFHALPAFIERYGPDLDPVRSASIPVNGQGMFAFVEFVDDVLASTAIEMSGFELLGRGVKVGRPQGYQSNQFGGDAPALDVQPLRDVGLIPRQPEPVGNLILSKKLRELWFGNLPTGKVDGAIIRELVTPVCLQLPEYDPDFGPPVTNVDMAPSGVYCFVQFQNAEMASRIMPVFDGTELCGKKLKVNRPSKYELNFQTPSQAQSLGSQAFLVGATAATSLLL